MIIAWLKTNYETLNKLARPVLLFGSGVAGIVGAFVPSVPVDKMLVLMGASGLLAGYRTWEKTRGVDAPPAPPTPPEP